MSQVLNIMSVFVHLCDKLQYLLPVTYIMTCTGFVFRFGVTTLTLTRLGPLVQQISRTKRTKFSLKLDYIQA